MSYFVAWGRCRNEVLALVLGLSMAALAACTGSEDSNATSAPPAATPTTSAAVSTATQIPPAATQVSPTATQVPPSATQPAATAIPASEAEDSGAMVDVLSVGEFGEILVGTNGLTLYIFDQDAKAESNCTGGCLDAWPPFLSDGDPVAGAGVTADIGKITRDDGTFQVTVDGFPAYHWAGDSAAGDTGGHGVGNVWWVFSAHGAPQRPAKIGVSNNAEKGEILVDGSGLALYIYDLDAEGFSNCSGACLRAWPPLLAQYGTVVIDDVPADFGTITRDDGTTQVTVNGFPAYYWAGESSAGDTGGHGAGNVWWVFNPDGSPQRPAKVTVAENPVLGNILVDGPGLTLYIFDNDTEGVSNCSGGCLGAWPPLLTEYGAVGIGDITAELGTITRDDGTTQVTVNGFPAYYWSGDSAEGDTGGQGRNDVWWVFNSDGTPQRPTNTAVSGDVDDYY